MSISIDAIVMHLRLLVNYQEQPNLIALMVKQLGLIVLRLLGGREDSLGNVKPSIVYRKFLDR